MEIDSFIEVVAEEMQQKIDDETAAYKQNKKQVKNRRKSTLQITGKGRVRDPLHHLPAVEHGIIGPMGEILPQRRDAPKGR